MGPEIDLTVTIVYDGPKARLATPTEAIPVIRQDLDAMGIPHPKAANVSVVFPGTMRFFWTALPHSTIQKNLQDHIRPKHNVEAHRELLRKLEIRDITLRVPEEPPPSHSGGNWKPDAGLYAVPMGAAFRPVLSDDPKNNPSMDYAEVNPNTIPVTASTAPSGSKTSWNRESQPRIKPEPISDMPIPPPPSSGSTSRQRYDVDEDMDIETPPPSATTAWPKAVKRNRYAHLAHRTCTPRQPSQTSRRDSGSHQPPSSSLYSTNIYDSRRRESESHHSRYESNSQLQTDLAQERTVIESLRELGVDMNSESEGGGGGEVDFVTKARIDHLTAELRAERAKRRRVEDVVEDIRRECRAPFVVPALLDAFVEVSRLTAEAMEEGEG
ncbi:hypothetical protein C8F04DRAFT_1081255 [Mycena alexandri]|uniref:Uncharacterized protein n=1 Tax=Mycena alexandri TaxID=1745969 RepID=A0AAD6T7N9_9AGAR|nr:hypothetical protein C8F04DRAFT_1081255 [Mycena alexandri]